MTAVADLATMDRKALVTRKAQLARLQELLWPAVIKPLRNALAAAERGGVFLAAQSC